MVKLTISTLFLMLQYWLWFFELFSGTSNRLNQRGKTPLFIIGPPRSGSTLVMQVITDAFDVGYLTNLHCRWFGAPALVEQWRRPLDKKAPSDFKSQHGQTSLDWEPAECGAWWYRFFRRHPGYVTAQDVTLRKMKAFRRSIAILEQATGRPLVFKNLYASLRLEPIAHYLPNALFVVIERDWVANGQSILKGRHDAFGNYGQWWSVTPPDVDELSKLPPVQQVVGQIQSIHDLINRDIERLGLTERTFRIRYEEFCKDVHGTLDAFQAFMESHGVELKRRFEVPAQFSIGNSIKIPYPIYEELRAEVSKRMGREIAGAEADR